MRILIDMNLTPRWCQLFETRQHEAFHWTSVGRAATAPDREVGEYARYTGLAFLTNDLELAKTLARSGVRYIIVLRGEPLTPEVRGIAVLDTVKAHRKIERSEPILLLDWSLNPIGTVTLIP